MDGRITSAQDEKWWLDGRPREGLHRIGKSVRSSGAMDRARTIGLLTTFASALAVGAMGVWLLEEYQTGRAILLVAGLFVIGVPLSLILGSVVRRALSPPD